MRFRLVEEPPGPADLELAELADADDLDAAIDDLLAAARAGPAVADLRTAGRPRIDLPTAIQAIVERAGDADGEIACVVASSAVAGHLARYLPGDQRSRRDLRIGAVDVTLMVGDLVAVRADAIVNASNTRLELGGGVSGALRRACGERLQREMRALAPIAPGGLAVTGPGDLATAGQILHVATASGEPDVVARAIEHLLAHCRRSMIPTVALPALGCGTGGLPVERCAAILRDAIAAHTGEAPSRVIVVLWTQADFDAFAGAFDAA